MNDKDPNLWREVFSPLGQVVAFFGGLGGLVNAVVTRKPWQETCRVVLVGTTVAFALGSTSPHILRKFVPELSEISGAALGLITSSAFIIGIIAVGLVEKFLTRAKQGGA